MMGHTHVTIGVAVGMAVGVATHATLAESVGLGAIAGLAALLPDIDHPQGKIRQQMGVAGRLSLFWLSHRGLTHTLVFWGFLGVLLSVLNPDVSVKAALYLGYASHLIADMLTRRGIPLFWPLSNRSIHLLPRPFRITSGGTIENIVWLLLLVCIGSMLVRFFYGLS